ncbi:MAG: hypothetical protein KDD82_21775 [Planctomycetes bacterium]|nr:hypothetical protein [Planctomycetota bacterium]
MGRAAGFGPCALCARELNLTFHHLIPRTTHRNKWFRKTFSFEERNRGLDVCPDCHGAIHRFVPNEKVLGRSFNTRELLLAHPELAAFVRWVSTRGARRFRTRGARAARRR